MAGTVSYPAWIAVDWGTSNLRAWAMSDDGHDVDHVTSDRGMGRLAHGDFEPTLMSILAPWVGDRPTTVVACGMVGSRQGWVEAPYTQVPCKPQSGIVTAPVQSNILRVHVIGGVKQDAPSDVMRGEETQIAGFLALNPDWDGVICLPGTHTKWAHISAGEIVSFQTFMTGEIFALLSKQSILRHSVSDAWDDDVFVDTLSDAMARPEALAARLFHIRAQGLLHGADDGWSAARLSGLLVGAELAAARPYWLGQSVAVIGPQTLAQHYVTALQAQAVPTLQTDATQMTLAGLKAAYASLKGTP